MFLPNVVCDYGLFLSVQTRGTLYTTDLHLGCSDIITKPWMIPLQNLVPDCFWLFDRSSWCYYKAYFIYTGYITNSDWINKIPTDVSTIDVCPNTCEHVYDFRHVFTHLWQMRIFFNHFSFCFRVGTFIWYGNYKGDCTKHHWLVKLRLQMVPNPLVNKRILVHVL